VKPTQPLAFGSEAVLEPVAPPLRGKRENARKTWPCRSTVPESFALARTRAAVRSRALLLRSWQQGQNPPMKVSSGRRSR
jgi:hypothetical protein